MDETTLARWQARLLGLLRAGAAPQDIRQALADDPELAATRAHAVELDLHALVVARELVARWRPDGPATDPTD